MNSGMELFFGLILALACFAVAALYIAWKLGCRTGYRRWKADAARAFQLGHAAGRREERASQRVDPLLDDGDDWKRGIR